MKTIQEIPLHQVPVVNPETTLDVVRDLLQTEPLKTVVLVSDEQYMGIFNQDALESGLVPTGVNLDDLTVGPYVHPARVIAHPGMDVSEVAALLRRKDQAVAPVVDNKTYKGMVTRADLETVND